MVNMYFVNIWQYMVYMVHSLHTCKTKNECSVLIHVNQVGTKHCPAQEDALWE